MKHIAIIGGGIAGVAAAYELSRQKRAGAVVEFTLFEATHRLGGIVETERRDGFVVECGPDSWVTEKNGARELAIELGLESEIIFSQDQHRQTYLAEENTLKPLPHGMRMMVPVEWPSVLASPLFSQQVKLDYQREPQLAAQLKATALDAYDPPRDESVRNFVIRHFGQEVADTIAAPLLTGVFGGDIATLSARAVLPAYVALEREHGSLILGLQKRQHSVSGVPIFTSLRNGVAGLIEGMESHIPPEHLCRGCAVNAIERCDNHWRVQAGSAGSITDKVLKEFDAILIATPPKTTSELLAPLNAAVLRLLPLQSSSAIVVALAFSADQAAYLKIPRGFGFLVPQRTGGFTAPLKERESLEALARRALLACTFVDQKFLHRAPAGAVLLRAFFGGAAAPSLISQDDASLAFLARTALENTLGKLPEASFALVRRWPKSLPLYQVGHVARIAELESRVAELPHLRLIGSAYHGVGLPDLIRDGRTAAREMVAALANATA